jgi:hypothetical protein
VTGRPKSATTATTDRRWLPQHRPTHLFQLVFAFLQLEMMADLWILSCEPLDLFPLPAEVSVAVLKLQLHHEKYARLSRIGSVNLFPEGTAIASVTTPLRAALGRASP